MKMYVQLYVMTPPVKPMVRGVSNKAQHSNTFMNHTFEFILEDPYPQKKLLRQPQPMNPF